MKTRIFYHLWALLVMLLAQPAAAQNLLANPDFGAGNTGFQTAYAYVTPTGTSNGGSYTITTDTYNFGTSFPHYGDHTTGSGNFMAVDAATGAALTVWEQTVTGLQPNQTYQFSFWLLNAYPSSKAQIQVSANGVDVGTAFTNHNDDGNWQLNTVALNPRSLHRSPSQMTYWQLNTVALNPGAGTQLIIRLRDLNLMATGNDFGLDDFSLTAPVANAQLTVNAVTTSSISTSATINATLISPLSATITGPAGATVANFTLATVPAVGTLRIGSATGAVAAAGQVLTAAQGSQLYYLPAGSTTAERDVQLQRYR